METILLVDDEQEQLRSIRFTLLSKGYKVIEAPDGPTALTYLDTSQPRIDMVITDFLMPGMDGMELLIEVRQRYGSMPVMMMTAHGEKSLVIKALRNQCDSFIEKPFSAAELIKEIERIKKPESPSYRL